MTLARHEMGEEAMLMNSREAPPETRHLGGYEVVFASSSRRLARRPNLWPVSSPSRATASQSKPPRSEEPVAPSID